MSGASCGCPCSVCEGLNLPPRATGDEHWGYLMENFCWRDLSEMDLVYLNPNCCSLEGCWCCSLLPSGCWGMSTVPHPRCGCLCPGSLPRESPFCSPPWGGSQGRAERCLRSHRLTTRPIPLLAGASALCVTTSAAREPGGLGDRIPFPVPKLSAICEKWQGKFVQQT